MGNTPSLKHHVDNAERTGVFQLTKANLTEFPKEISRLKNNIRSLDLSLNKLRLVPSFIGHFTNLRKLSLNHNRLTEVPPEIGQLKKLENLSLNCNQLISLPSGFSGLSSLRTISVNENKLQAFPIFLKDLKHLDSIDLSKNKITAIPDGIQSMQVSELNLNQNQVYAISEDIAACSRLKVLRLEENCLQLSMIPKKVLAESQISLLAVDGNLFEMKDFRNAEGYESYMERYTATKKKMM